MVTRCCLSGALVAATLLTGCSETKDGISPDATSQAILQVAGDGFTYGQKKRGVRCLMFHATEAERAALASDARRGIGAATVQTVQVIAQRPQTQRCLRESNVLTKTR
ncbi:hypothetical protein [Palleronia caenipelagi]|nr:hypothetical protein [Palleronia caenipelagi]